MFFWRKNALFGHGIITLKCTPQVATKCRLDTLLRLHSRMPLHFSAHYRALGQVLRATITWARAHLVWIVLLAGLILWGWLDVRQRGFVRPDAPDEHKTDLTVYSEAGAALLDGRPPYEVANPRGWTYLYPPLFALLLAPLAQLQPQDQVFVWYLISLGFCFGCYLETKRLFRVVVGESAAPADAPDRLELPDVDVRSRKPAARADDSDGSFPRPRSRQLTPMLGWLALAAAVLPTLNCLQRGQVGVLKLYLLLIGVRLVLTARSRWMCLTGGMILALPVVMKVIPAVPAGVFLLALVGSAWAARTLGAGTVRINQSASPSAGNITPPVQRAGMALAGLAAGVLLFALLLPGAVLGWKNNLDHLETWAELMLAKAADGGLDPRSGNSRSARNQSMQNAVARLGNFAMYLAGAGPDDQDVPLTAQRPLPPMPMDHPIVQKGLVALRAVLFAAVLIVAWRLGTAGSRLDLAAAFALGCVAMLVISPIARGHYFMLYVPGVIFVPLWLARHGDLKLLGKSLAQVLAISPAVVVIAHYTMLSVAGRMGLLGLGTTGWLLAALAACDRLIARPHKRCVPLASEDQTRVQHRAALDVSRRHQAAA